VGFPSEYGAGEESRTLDLNLGKVALYQLSYSRVDRNKIINDSEILSSNMFENLLQLAAAFASWPGGQHAAPFGHHMLNASRVAL
jgi:hypothetical protein